MRVSGFASTSRTRGAGDVAGFMPAEEAGGIAALTMDSQESSVGRDDINALAQAHCKAESVVVGFAGVGSAPTKVPRQMSSVAWGKMSGKCRPALLAPEQATPPVVLVVEDEVVLRMAVCAHLRDAGFVVIEAVDAGEAVNLVDANKSIALVFSDVNMPGPADGNDLAAWIAGGHPDIKVLLTSGVAQAGGPPFIGKPYSFAELQRRIEAMLRSD